MTTKSLFFSVLICIGFFFLLFKLFTSIRDENRQQKVFPSDWFFQQRAYPDEQINHTEYLRAIEQTQQLKKSIFNRGPKAVWKFAGPTNVEGRLTDVEMHPTDLQTIYVGAASGGIFKTINGGNTWVPIFDNEMSLSIGDMAIAPSNPNILYVGTGEANAGGGSTTYDGVGVYKSLDAGKSWTHKGLMEIRNTGRIVIDSKNPDRVFVAGMGNLYANNPERGVFRSLDGGNHWERVLYVSDSTGGIDLIINPLNTNQVFAAMWERVRRINKRSYGGITSGIYMSNDGGTTWNRTQNGLPINIGNVGRIGLTISPSNPKFVYAVYADKTGYFMGLYKSIDGGLNWTRTKDASLKDVFASYGWWFGRVTVDPTDPATIYVIGYDTYRSTDGGETWVNITTRIHVDHHSLVIHPLNPNYLFLGGDGGLFYSINKGMSWQHNAKLPITQFYTCEIDNSQPAKLYGGAQDNNVLRTTTGGLKDWKSIIGGDGLEILVDPVDPSFIYGEYQYGSLMKSIDGGANFFEATSGISNSDRKNWKTPIIFDPTNSHTLYYGSNRLYRSVDQADSWNVISPDLTNGSGGNGLGTITCIANARANNSVIYAGTDDGNVWLSINAGNSWNKISTNLPNRWVTRIAIDKNPATAFVTLSGFRKNEYLSHVFKTLDFGSTWIDISGNLPEAPVNDIIVDPQDSTILYLASDMGVFIGSKEGSWKILGDSLPLVPITDICLHKTTGTIVAATYGRSMYKLKLELPTSIKEVEFNKNSKVKIVPNPVSLITKIKFNLEKSQKLEIVLFDITGKIVCAIYSGNLERGMQEIIWDRKNSGCDLLPAGNYICKIQGSNLSLSTPIQIAD